MPLLLALGLGPIAGCEQREPLTTSPVDAAAEVQRRLKLTAFVRSLERERYVVSFDGDDLGRGASDPLVTIVAFVDYAAPDHDVDAQLERLLAAHPQDVRLVVLHHPGANAELAARAVLAAHMQDCGWAMHARLAARGEGLGFEELRRHASEIEVPDLDRFEQHMTVVASKVRANVEQARRLDIERRPTLFVNGVAVVGSEAADSLAEVVETELETASRLVALGARRDEVHALLMSRAAQDRVEPPGPVEIPWEPEFAVAALSSELRDDGVLIEELVVGEGPEVVEGKLVEFEFDGYASASGKLVMGSREEPAKLVLTEAARKRDPVATVMVDALLGMRVGGKRRVKIPAAIAHASKPEGRPSIGDLWMAVELIAIHDGPKLEPIEAFAGKPIASKRHDDGLEVVDYRRGSGPRATAGMIVTTHYIGHLTDGTEFDNSHGRAEGLVIILGPEPGVITGFARGLEGARVGMLRKLVIPPELAYGDRERGNIPANSTLTFYLQITDVRPVKDGEAAAKE